MRIERFLEKINYKVKSGSIYSGKELKDLLLYQVNFTNRKENEFGTLLISAKNQKIYLIKYYTKEYIYYYKHKLYDYVNSSEKEIKINSLLQIISK